MNVRLPMLAAVSFAAVAFVCSTASADRNDRRAGTSGHVTAWEPDRTAVIDVEACPADTRGSWDYAACGARFCASVNAQLCRARGKGRHAWLYQVGAAAVLTTNVARCD